MDLLNVGMHQRIEFHVQVDDIEDVLPVANQFMHDKLTDPQTYGIKEENFGRGLYDIVSIESVWGLAVPEVAAK